MRNLKRALSLALASVMLLGMMVVGTGASYADVDSADNVEAIEVMQAVGVMSGDDNGNFNPDQNLTRGEMAVVMANLLDLSVEDFVGASIPFTDVPEWAVPYVAACYADGITAGISATEFGSNYEVTTAQAALMMMKALGYFQNAKDFGSDWQIATVKQGSKIYLFDGIDAGASTAMTRNEVAQIALNTLESVMVETDGTTTDITLPGDISISTGDTKYVERETSKYDYNDENDGLLQLCENLYGNDLKKTDDPDDFGRPGTTWKYDGDAVAFGSEDALKVYAGADFDADVVKDLKKDYTFGDTYYNGAKINKDYTDFQECKGVTVELYANDEDVITVVVTEAYVAELTTINTDDDDKVTDVVVTVTEAGRLTSSKGEYTMAIDVEDDEDAYELVKNYKEDDVFMVFLKPGWDNDDKAAGDLLAVANVETVEGKVTATSFAASAAYDKISYNGSWIRIDGTKYNFANEYSRETVATDSEGTFYIYNGYIVHFDGEAAASEDYLYVVRVGTEKDKWESTTNYAEVVYTDGTSEVIQTKDEATEGQVYSYSFNEKKDYYELSDAGTQVTANIEKGKTAVGGGKTADSQTVYVSIKLDDDKFDSAKVYTGYKNVPSMTGTAYVVAEADKKAADYVFIVDGTTSASSDDLIYISKASVSGLINDADLGEYYTYTAVVGGKVTEIMVAKDAGAELNGLYASYSVDEDGIYSDLKPAEAGDDKDYLTTTGDFEKASNEVITVGDAGTMAYTDNVVVYVIDGKNITIGSINRNYSDNTAINYTVDSDDAVTALYIVK